MTAGNGAGGLVVYAPTGDGSAFGSWWRVVTATGATLVYAPDLDSALLVVEAVQFFQGRKK